MIQPVAASPQPLSDHTAAIFVTNAAELWDGKSGERGTKRVRPRRLAVFKLPAYDPVGIAVLGFGIVFAVALALVF